MVRRPEREGYGNRRPAQETHRADQLPSRCHACRRRKTGAGKDLKRTGRLYGLPLPDRRKIHAAVPLPDLSPAQGAARCVCEESFRFPEGV